jgi:PII-like signaling protein
MKPESEATLLRIFIGESDLHHHVPLSEVIVKKSHDAGLAGATVLRGLMSYGASSHFRSARILDLASDLPVVVEIVDTESKIKAFLPVIDQLFEETRCGGLVTRESVHILKYSPGK